MPLQTDFPLVDEILRPYAPLLRGDFDGYRNHVHRVLHHYQALSGGAAVPEVVLLAAPHHDLGIWTDRSFDYLAPSVRLALADLAARGLSDLGAEVRLLISEHHKLLGYRGPYERTVELYRRADWVDVSLGLLRFGLSMNHLRAVRAAFPDAGFHARLAVLTARQCLRTPWRPLPMMHW
jgi:hypothetical protein